MYKLKNNTQYTYNHRKLFIMKYIKMHSIREQRQYEAGKKITYHTQFSAGIKKALKNTIHQYRHTVKSLIQVQIIQSKNLRLILEVWRYIHCVSPIKTDTYCSQNIVIFWTFVTHVTTYNIYQLANDLTPMPISTPVLVRCGIRLWLDWLVKSPPSDKGTCDAMFDRTAWYHHL